jgi:arylsulfatase A-like enzyme
VVSLFTGVYPQQHGVNSLGDIIPERLVSIQEIMVRTGLETSAFVTNDFLKPVYGYNRGFGYYVDKYLRQDFKDHIAANLFFLNAILYFKNELFFPLAVDPGGAKWWSIGIPPFNHKKISAETVTDDALEWIRIHRNMPFYMYIHYMDVHCPYDTYWYPLYDKGAYESQDTQAKLTNIYNGRIVYVDQQINRIWEVLKQLGLIDKTMLIVTADHGEELYDHGGTGHCTTLYEELIRIPLIMHVPSFEGKHITLEHQVELTDIPVTVLDFLGLRIPQYMQGQSLLPLLANPSSKLVPSYAISYTTRGRKSLKTREGRELWDKKVWDQEIIMQSLRLNNKWKVIIFDDGRAELFNLKRDKGEQSSVQASQQVIFENLKKKLLEITSKLKIFTPGKEQKTLSPEMKNRLKALGYVS